MNLFASEFRGSPVGADPDPLVILYPSKRIPAGGFPF